MGTRGDRQMRFELEINNRGEFKLQDYRLRADITRKFKEVELSSEDIHMIAGLMDLKNVEADEEVRKKILEITGDENDQNAWRKES